MTTGTHCDIVLDMCLRYIPKSPHSKTNIHHNITVVVKLEDAYMSIH